MDLHISAMVMGNLLSNRKPESGSAILPVSHERLEGFFSNGFWDARTVVTYKYLHMVVHSSRPHGNFPSISRSRLTGILQEVVESSIELFEIEPSICRAFVRKLNLDLAEFDAELDGGNGPLKRIEKIAVRKLEGLLGFRELQ